MITCTDLSFLDTRSSAPALPSFDLQSGSTPASKLFNFGFPSTSAANLAPSAQPVNSQPFSFSKPAAPAFSTSSVPVSFSTDAASIQIEPQTPAKSLSIGDFSFLSAQNKSAKTLSPAPAATPGRPLPGGSEPALLSDTQPSQPRSQIQAPASTTAPSFVVPEEPQPQQIDEGKLLEQLCRIGLVQKDGIIDMFVSYRISSLVKEVFKTFQDQCFTKQTSKQLSQHPY